MGLFKKYVTCTMTFFTPFTFVKPCQFYSSTSPILFTKNDKLWNERKENLLYIWLFQPISLYQRRQKIISLGTIEFFFLSGFCFTNIHEPQNCKGRGRAFHQLLTTTSTCFTYTLRHQPGNYCRELTSGHSQQPDSKREPLVSECKSLTTKLCDPSTHIYI